MQANSQASFGTKSRVAMGVPIRDKDFVLHPQVKDDYVLAIYVRGSRRCGRMQSNDDLAFACQKSIRSFPLSHQFNRAAWASARSVAVKRNNMFSNRIYRGMPTIVLLVVAGIIEFLAIYAFA